MEKHFMSGKVACKFIKYLMELFAGYVMCPLPTNSGRMPITVGEKPLGAC